MGVQAVKKMENLRTNEIIEGQSYLTKIDKQLKVFSEFYFLYR